MYSRDSLLTTNSLQKFDIRGRVKIRPALFLFVVPALMYEIYRIRVKFTGFLESVSELIICLIYEKITFVALRYCAGCRGNGRCKGNGTGSDKCR